MNTNEIADKYFPSKKCFQEWRQAITAAIEEATTQLQTENLEMHRKLARFMVVFNRLNSEHAAAWVALQTPENELKRDLSNAEKRSVEAWQQVIRIGELVNRSVSHEIESEVARLVSENIQLQAEKVTTRESALREAAQIASDEQVAPRYSGDGFWNRACQVIEAKSLSLITTPASECEKKPCRRCGAIHEPHQNTLCPL